MPFDPAAAASRVVQSLGSPAGAELRELGLFGLPTGAVLELDEYLGELMREVQIIGAASPPGATDDALGLVQLLLGLFDPVRQTVRDAAAHAYEAGLPCFDLQLALPAAGAEAARAMRAAFDEVQRMCDAGLLLSLPAGDDLGGFFAWFLGAFAALSP